MDGQCGNLNWVIHAGMWEEKGKSMHLNLQGFFSYFFFGWGNIHSHVDYSG